MAPLIVIAIGAYSRPRLPPRPITGMNTTTRAIEVDTTAPPSSAMASRAACRGGLPSSRRRPMSSLTTMASSTTSPEASTKPNRVRVLSDWPASFSTLNEPIKATGTAAAVIRARRLLPRPRSSTKNTSNTASRRLSRVPWMLPRTKSASSTISC